MKEHQVKAGTRSTIELGAITRGDKAEALPELHIPEFINVEANLASLGFFTPSTQKTRNVKKKTVKITRLVNGKREEKRVTVIPTAVHGLPTTADQDKYLALMRIIHDVKLKKGTLTNPITFASADILKLLGQTDAGKNYRDIRDWLERITGTLIISDQAVYLADRKEWRSAAFHVFERFISRGEQLEDGTTAEKHYVYLSDWQLHNLNCNHSLPIDWATYWQLKSPIAKALIFPLQIVLYATKEKGVFKKKYAELARLLSVTEYQYVSKIREKLGPSLDELKEHGYLADWKIAKTSDGKGYKILLFHGEKFYRDQTRVLDENNFPQEPLTGSGSPEDPDPQSATPGEPIAELCKRGLSKTDATAILRSLAPDQPVLDQLEYIDTVTAKGTIENPIGFLVAFLKENRSLPPSFVSTRQRKLQEAQWEEEQRVREEFRAHYESFKSRQVKRYVREQGLEDHYESRIETRRASYRRLMGNRPDDELTRMVTGVVQDEIAQEMPDLISEQEFLELENSWHFSGRNSFGDKITKTKLSNGGNMHETS